MARKRYGVLGAVNPNTGGTSYDPYTKPAPKPDPGSSYIMPPALSFDPSIEADRRSAQRGLSDRLQDVATKEHFADKDLSQALKDIRVGTRRKRQDLNIEAQRGQRKLGFETEDATRSNRRANQDFDTAIANIGRRFAQLGQTQNEGANAAGVLDKGTRAASGAARAGNQALAEAPIDVARGRANEDLATTLSRIGVSRSDLGSDHARELGRLKENRDRERLLSNRTNNRTDFEAGREKQRAIREGKITDVDLLTQEIYAARAEHPQVFRAWAQEHPEAVAKVEDKPKNSTGRSGGTSPGGGNKKRKKR